MRRSAQLTVILLAWLLATGAQWDLLQTFGWARMIVNYSQTMSLGDAVAKTFDGEMCNVCKVVSDAKQQETGATVPSGHVNLKLVLVYQPTSGLYFSDLPVDAWSLTDHPFQSAERAAPALPPPRV